MLKVYIKNYLKIILRKKWIIVLMIMFPLFLIAVLSSVFNDLMNRNITLQEITVGYVTTDETLPTATLEELFTENNMKLKKYKLEDKEAVLQEKKVAAFIEITKDSYTISKTSENALEIAVVENLCYSFFQQYQVQPTYQGEIAIQTETLDITELPSAVDYYGIIEIVYFTWFGFIALTIIISSERKYSILERIHMATISNGAIYLAKFIPAVLICFLEMVIAILLSYILFGVHWGNIPLSLMLIFLSIVAGISFSLLILSFCKQILISTVIIFFSTFIMGFIGGSFQMYQFSSFSEAIKQISPLYYINRTLVELSTTGTSKYILTTVLILTLFSMVCTAVTVLRMNRKEGVL